MVVSGLADRALTLIVLGGIGFMIYMKFKRKSEPKQLKAIDMFKGGNL